MFARDLIIGYEIKKTRSMYKKQVALLFASLFGALISVYGTILSIEVRKYSVGIPSFCSINALFDCNYVAASETSLLLGIPVAWWGFLYYLWIGTIVIWAFISSSNQRPPMAMALTISTLALALIIYKAYQLIFKLKVVCLVCILMYFAYAAIVFLLISILDLKFRNMLGKFTAKSNLVKGKSLKSSITAYLAGLFSVIVVFLTGYSIFKISYPIKTPNIARIISHSDKIPNNPVLRSHFAQTKRIIELIPDAPVWGNPQADVTIVEFSDFQCPFCRIAASNLKNVLSEFSDNVRLYFIHYPLDRSINPYIQTKGHQYAGLAARASIYAKDHGKFWEFHDDLFRQQHNLSNETILFLAKKYRWDIDQFKIAIESNHIIKRVKMHINCGQEVDIQGTPTIYINGRFVNQWQNTTVLRQIIEYEIRRSLNT